MNFLLRVIHTPSNVSNYYQHPSYGFNIKGISNDGKVNGSAYSNQNGGMGVIWGNYGSSGSDGLVYLKYYQDSIAVGTNYTSNPHASDGHTFVLNHQLASDIDKFTITKWVLRDSDGNLVTDNFNDADINSLKKGTYYATFYGKDSNSLYSWNTMLLNVVDKGTVKTHYVDKNGNQIANDDVITGPAGGNYTTTKKSIKGYNFFKTDGNASGLFNNQNIDVTYIYVNNQIPSNNGFNSGNDNSNNSGNNNNSNSSSNNNNNSNIAKKGQAVYAINKIYLYKSNNFCSYVNNLHQFYVLN